MTMRISLFNHKGGVSKTTTTFNLGWMLATKGKRVILVDSDPQCNLTGMVLGYRGPDELENFFTRETNRNLMAGLAPAFESQPKSIEPVDCIEVNDCPGLYLLPGHIRLAEYEITLGISQELSGSIQTLQNLPGSLSFLLSKTAERHKADYMLVDMSPSLSPINQNFLITSDFFIVPTAPDFFSAMAVDSLSSILPKWHAWAEQAKTHPVLQEAAYPFPQTVPKFLGVIYQNYRPRGGAPAAAFQRWINVIATKVINGLLPALDACGMLLDPSMYESVGLPEDRCIASIPDFNSLIAKSQSHQTPIFALTDDQIGGTGVVLKQAQESRNSFKEIFSKMTDRILGLTIDAAGP